MRKYIIILLIFNFSTYAQLHGKIKMTYDAVGNQVKRVYIIINGADKMDNSNVKQTDEINSTDLLKSDIYDDIKYYPNPVQNTLYVEWQYKDQNNVTDALVYSTNGQLLKQYNNLDKLNNTIITFDNYPSGYYDVVLLYLSGERKTLKIIKK